MPAFWVHPNRSPLDQVLSISSVSGKFPLGPSPWVAVFNEDSEEPNQFFNVNACDISVDTYLKEEMQKSKGDLNQVAFAVYFSKLYFVAVSVGSPCSSLSIESYTEGKGWHNQVLIV